ncbi:MAG TPA: hypothetical protein VFZ14_12030 [Burkholderiales bacterium]|nr:hypothetical protein [Burkholderiales bacterium]
MKREPLRVLIAGIPETNPRMSSIFAQSRVTFLDTMDRAAEALKQRYDAILIAVRFDESRMFDLLRCLADQGISNDTPVICYRSRPGPVTSTRLALQAIQLASRSLGAEFFDLESYPDEAAGNAAIRALVENLIRRSRKRAAPAA